MSVSLNRLIAEARVLAGGEHECAALGHGWGEMGGRPCPRNADAPCSQTVYRCRACGDWDYGEPGGPGFADCFTNGPCDFACTSDSRSAAP